MSCFKRDNFLRDWIRRTAPVFLILILLGGSTLIASSQELANLTGRVSDAETGLPLAAANVSIRGTRFQTAADETGWFRFYGLSPGHCDLEVTHVGYEPATVVGLVLIAETPTEIQIQLHQHPVQLEEVVVTANTMPVAGALSGGRIISQETLKRASQRSLAEILQKEGLADVSSDGSPGGRETVTIRGSASDQVLVLLDGKPMNQVSDGIADLASVSPSEVRRIEVYPQAPPDLGSQAIGGVINIVTWQPGADQFQLKAGIGEYGAKQGSLTAGRLLTSWAVLGSFEHQESAGRYRYRVVEDDGLDLFTREVGQIFTRQGAAYRRDYLSLKLDPPGGLDVGYRRTVLHRQNPDYLPLPLLDHESTTDDDRQEFYLNVHQKERWFQPDIRLSVESYQQETATNYGDQYPLLNQSSRLRGETYDAEATWSRQWQQPKGSLRDWDNVSFGTGLRVDRLWSSDLEGGYAERSHQFGYFQAHGDPVSDLNLPFSSALFSGVRADLYRDEGAFVHPRLGLQLDGKTPFETNWTMRGEVVSAYRLPSFNALFWQEDLQSKGNPNLKPERSLNRELTGRISHPYWDVGVSYFDRDVWDLIYWRLDFDNRWKPLNLSRAWIYGTEISIRGRSGQGSKDLEVSLTHRWMRAVNLSGEANTDAKLLPYRPETTTTLSLLQKFGSYSADLSARWVDRRYTTEANTKSLAPYAIWDFGLARIFRLNHGGVEMTVRAEVRNLFNEDYRLVENAPVPLREWWLSISFNQIFTSQTTYPDNNGDS